MSIASALWASLTYHSETVLKIKVKSPIDNGIWLFYRTFYFKNVNTLPMNNTKKKEKEEETFYNCPVMRKNKLSGCPKTLAKA